MNIENRYTATFSIREENGKTILSGLAVPYWNGQAGTEYELAPGYFERFQPGAFKNLADDITANLQHEQNKVLGVTPDTLKIREEQDGLYYDCVLTDDSYSRDAKALIASKKIKGSSIGFVPLKLEQKREGAKNVVYVREAKLDHIAIVTRPAYKATDAYLRQVQDNAERELMNLYEKRMDEILNSIVPSHK